MLLLGLFANSFVGDGCFSRLEAKLCLFCHFLLISSCATSSKNWKGNFSSCTSPLPGQRLCRLGCDLTPVPACGCALWCPGVQEAQGEGAELHWGQLVSCPCWGQEQLPVICMEKGEDLVTCLSVLAGSSPATREVLICLGSAVGLFLVLELVLSWNCVIVPWFVCVLQCPECELSHWSNRHPHRVSFWAVRIRSSGDGFVLWMLHLEQIREPLPPLS